MASENFGITPDLVGPDGKVAVWIIPTKTWRRKAPIDAMELIRVGSASLEGDGNRPEDPPMPEQLKILSVREAAGNAPRRTVAEPARVLGDSLTPTKTARRPRPGK